MAKAVTEELDLSKLLASRAGLRFSRAHRTQWQGGGTTMMVTLCNKSLTPTNWLAHYDIKWPGDAGWTPRSTAVEWRPA